MARRRTAQATPPSPRWTRVKQVLVELRGRPDSEHEMSFNRVACMAVTFTYIAIGNPHPQGFWALVAFSIASVAAFLHILYDPGVRVWRRLTMIVVDVTGLSYLLYVNGESAAGLWPFYLWTILGNGFRLGNRYLFVAAAMAILCFSLVIAMTPFWNEHRSLAIGLLIGLIVIPAYSSRLIKKLSAAKAAAEDASRAKSYFLASVSHELRTPLTAIIGLGAHLRDSDLTSEQRNMAGTVVTAGRSLLSLINQLLDFARLGAKGITTEAKPFDLLPMLFSVRDLLRVGAEEKGLRLDVHVSARTPLHILGDEMHIRDVLVNLVGNAIKFTDSGSITVAADAEAMPGGRWRLKLAVADTGIGIDPESQKHIFESFRQADDTIIDRFGGTGLGLAICKQIATLLGGDIGVDSAPGQGSRFWFTAQVGDASQDEEQAAPIRGEYLLFSTNARTISTMGIRLAEAGLSLRTCGNLAEARSLALESSPGLPRAVLIDERAVGEQTIPIASAREALGAEITPVLLRAAADGPDDANVERNFACSITQESSLEELARALHIATGGIPLTEAEAPQEAVRPSRSLRILVADDNVMNQKVFSMILGRAGHSVETADNGEAALDVMKDHSFDIVLMDVNMPVLNGIEATKLYRFTALGRKRIPIVGITADASPATHERCIDAGMDACIAKPVEAAPLLQLIDELTEQSGTPIVPSYDPSGVIVPLFRQEEPESPAINVAKLMELEELGGPEFVQELLEQYINDAESLLAEIRESVARDDVTGFRDGTHALRSSGANIGADKVAELCLHLQRIERAEFEAKANDHVAGLDAELQRVRAALEASRQTVPAAARK